MGPAVEFLILPASGLLLVAGFALVIWSLGDRDRAKPMRPTLRPRVWKPVWRQRDHFASETAFSRYVVGVGLVMVGALFALIHAILR